MDLFICDNSHVLIYVCGNSKQRKKEAMTLKARGAFRGCRKEREGKSDKITL